MAAVRVLEAGDETVLFRFLERRLESSLFFLSNIEAAGLEDRGEARQATYVAHFLEGEVTAVAAHSWNGLIMVQGDVGLEEAVRAAVGR
ncbi:MAG TPA: hypothetical protein VER33_27630, partial [Polyangiaceae bacterium]|nr:hypothetical protein [Polyangiaceae bacterium]